MCTSPTSQPTKQDFFSDGSVLWSDSSTRRRTYVISRDFIDRVHVLFLEILCDSGKTFFDISVNTGQICMELETDTPQKL